MNQGITTPDAWARWGWVVEGVATRYGVAITDLLGRCREQRLADARSDLYACLWGSGLALAEIGRMLDRDHTTVRNGIRKDLSLWTSRGCRSVLKRDPRSTSRERVGVS